MRGSSLLRRMELEPREASVFVWGGAVLFLIGWVDVSVKNVAETLFLKRVGVERLPVVFLVNSVLLVGTTYGASRLVTGRDRLRLLPITLVALAAALLPMWLLVRLDVDGAVALLVLASKQITSITLLVFWVSMGDLLHARQAKRLFAPLIAGVTLGTMAGSFASKPLGDLLGIAGVLPFAAAMLVAGGAAALPLRRLRPGRLERGIAAPRDVPEAAPARYASESRALFAPLWRDSGLFRLLLVASACAGLLGPMLYFQFSYVADLATAGEDAEERLLAFYAQFRGWISVGVLAAQLAVTANLYRRIGVPLAAALSPLVYLLGFLGLSVRLSLPAGVGAMAGTKLTDNAVYDPALRVLFNLFPESLRAGATALLEGPVKRAGGALGNVLILGALALGSAPWVGYAALPIAAAWIAVSLLLWRAYPSLLLHASAGREGIGDALEGVELMDPATLRALAPRLADADPASCQLAIDLVSEARPELAVGALARAAAEAPDATRPLLIAALDRVLEASVAHPVANREAAARLATLLERPERLSTRDRADAVQAIGRLTAGLGESDETNAVLERSLSDAAPAVRVAADAALCRRSQPPRGVDLDGVLAAAIASEDRETRRIGREELRSLLLAGEPDEIWGERLERLTTLLAVSDDRADAAEAIADIAARHGAAVAPAGEAMLRLRGDSDPRVQAAVLRFAGRAGLHTEAAWLVEHVAADGFEGAEQVRAAASEGLSALGPSAADVLLVELGCGKRSTRDAILPIVRQLDVEPEMLRSLYGGELESVRRSQLHRIALRERPRAAIVAQRLDERIAEGLHTALLLLAAIHDSDRIAQLGERLVRADGRQRAILLEALDAVLDADDRDRLMPLLENRERGNGRGRRGAPVPTFEQARRALLEEPDDLTRALALVSFADEGTLAGMAELKDDPHVLSPVEVMLHLKSLPVFEDLTTRQLMDLAKVVVEEDHPEGAVVVREGDQAESMYLIVDGEVEVRKGETSIRKLGARSFFGEMAVFEGAPRSATVVAMSGVRLLALKREDLFRMMEDLPAIAIAICRTMSRRVRELTSEHVNG